MGVSLLTTGLGSKLLIYLLSFVILMPLGKRVALRIPMAGSVETFPETPTSIHFHRRNLMSP
jgi:hypothetical protein